MTVIRVYNFASTNYHEQLLIQEEKQESYIR